MDMEYVGIDNKNSTNIKLKNDTTKVKQKKYGLMWEEKQELVVEMCKERLPVLIEDRTKEIKHPQTPEINILIEGDNFHALSILNYTHRKKIDAIYIDPPFNTGSKNWKYNNDYVDKEDAFRHSKWLSMMDKRLRLAKPLLKDDGVLICAIDENELWHLGNLLEEIFFDKEIHLITIVHNPRGIQGKNFSYVNEFAFFVIPKGKKVIGPRKLDDDEIYWSNLRNWGGESDRSDAKNCFYPIMVKDSKIIGFGDVPDDDDYHPKDQVQMEKDCKLVWPIDINGKEKKWRYARQSVEQVEDLLRVRKGSNGRIEIEIGKPYGTVKTVWQSPRYDAAEYGTKLIHELVPDNNFDFPKSVYNVYDCLAPIVDEKKEAIILDFFAGSGTTGHAVMMLNKKDGGSRQFILCTNNEKGIAEEICYPRVKAVISGNEKYKDITGYPANLKYFKTDFVDSSPTDINKKNLVDRSTEMLCLKENCFNFIKGDSNFKIFSGYGDKYLGIIYDDDGIEQLKLEVSRINKKFSVYIFSLDEGVKEDDFEEIADLVDLKPIPASILNVYKRIYR